MDNIATDTDETTIQCRQCQQDFVMTISERAWYRQRGLHTPKRCTACRKARRERSEHDA